MNKSIRKITALVLIVTSFTVSAYGLSDRKITISTNSGQKCDLEQQIFGALSTQIGKAETQINWLKTNKNGLLGNSLAATALTAGSLIADLKFNNISQLSKAYQSFLVGITVWLGLSNYTLANEQIELYEKLMADTKSLRTKIENDISGGNCAVESANQSKDTNEKKLLEKKFEARARLLATSVYLSQSIAHSALTATTSIGVVADVVILSSFLTRGFGQGGLYNLVYMTGAAAASTINTPVNRFVLKVTENEALAMIKIFNDAAAALDKP